MHNLQIRYHSSFDTRVKTRSNFKDQPVYRCEVQEMFSKSSNLHYYKCLMPELMNISV